MKSFVSTLDIHDLKFKLSFKGKYAVRENMWNHNVLRKGKGGTFIIPNSNCHAYALENRLEIEISL